MTAASPPSRQTFFKSKLTTRECDMGTEDPATRRNSAYRTEPNGVEPAFSEEDIQRQKFGPRGVPGKSDPATMTPQRKKKTPENVDPGHTA